MLRSILCTYFENCANSPLFEAFLHPIQAKLQRSRGLMIILNVNFIVRLRIFNRTFGT
jgi:hypothetical protein